MLEIKQLLEYKLNVYKDALYIREHITETSGKPLSMEVTAWLIDKIDKINKMLKILE